MQLALKPRIDTATVPVKCTPLQTLAQLPLRQVSTPRYYTQARRRCREITRAGVQTVQWDVATSEAAMPGGLSIIVEDFASCGSSAQDRIQLLLQYAKKLPPMGAAQKVDANRVMGCTAQAWVSTSLDDSGLVCLTADSESAVTRGLAAVLVSALSGLAPDQLLAVEPSALAPLGLGPAVLTPSRTNGFVNMLEAVRRQTRMLIGNLPAFPSLIIDADGISAQGDFAKAQAEYLQPDVAQVAELVEVLSSKHIGIVAHFYMDPQVQGVLTSAAAKWPHIHISDSLVMADSAVAMAKAGCTAICVLGVDFMSENVRAILDEAGHHEVEVYRMAADDIGCSLADAAEAPPYDAYLADAQASKGPALHVVYINTSLRTKANAHVRVPTITCTSSNVVQTILQAFAQVPGLSVYYGPDTYMGQNLVALFTSLAKLSDDEVQAIHPGHTQATIRALLPRLHFFQNGTCIVHHIFGGRVTELVAAAYSDAFLTAHFEVPGEMFELAMAAKRERDMGVVGSTQNILDFIAAKLSLALNRPFPDRLQFVLGTEAGMITSIVRKVQRMIADSGRSDVVAEIVFPVSPDAIATVQSTTAPTGLPSLPGGLSVIPGAASGEGCSAEGGCASCPYMKMNSLQALMSVCSKIGSAAGRAMLESYKPRAYTEVIAGRSVAQVGCEPILHMRYFQKNGNLSTALVDDIVSRKAQ